MKNGARVSRALPIIRPGVAIHRRSVNKRNLISLRRRTNVMTRNFSKLNRREALSTIGAAAAAGILMTATTREVQAQSSVLSFVIDTYRAYYYSAPQYSYEARINLYSVGNAQTCSLIFIKDGETIPTNTVAANGVSGSVHYAGSRLAAIRELLRNERPVRLTVNGANGIATLSNDEYELVGDADF